EAAEVEAKEGHLPAGAALRHRIRYLSEGVILGSRAFIDRWLDRNRWRFGYRASGRGSDRRQSDLSSLGILPAVPG
ncbi:MAG: hypothetical protein L6R30_02955, partial [Thermoanaerobaculia bacterium]|nr:hypothetical protein [Thermoanaerobaculia bacterium]